MKTINLAISNMKSSHCQMTVTNTVRAIGAKISSIAPARAEIELPDGISKETVIQAIQKAGYNVSDETT